MKDLIEGIKMTSYSHGAGCGCKISPKDLTTILKTKITTVGTKNLVVGNDTRDDAAVYDIGNGKGIISTTDFFLPIVDDPFEFGKIAAANAISDIYAMGGKPLMAIAILGWPVDKISNEVANTVVEGGRAICKEAGIPLAGGHSIDNPEPIFGLAVTGIVDLDKLRRNDNAKPESILFLTKPLGVGILSTAQKDGKILKEHADIAPKSMMKLNKVGGRLSEIEGITAMTDVTGFGLLGHLLEVCEGSNVSAELEFDKIPVFKPVEYYISEGCIPGGTKRNWRSYKDKIELPENEVVKNVLCDAQTSGGLLIAVKKDNVEEVISILKEEKLYSIPIGMLKEYNGGKHIIVK